MFLEMHCITKPSDLFIVTYMHFINSNSYIIDTFPSPIFPAVPDINHELQVNAKMTVGDEWLYILYSREMI